MIKTKFRNIKTKIPASASRHALLEMKKYEPEEMCSHEVPVIWNKAEDFQVYDEWGNKWIDFTSGIFVANVGHSQVSVKSAILNKIKKSLLHSYVFPNQDRIELAKKLCQILKMEQVLFTVTGSEANDAVLQMIRRNRKGKVLSIDGAYYGSTAACRQIAESTIDESSNPNDFNPKKIAGVFLQVFRGKDAKFLPYEWIRTWVKWGKDNNIPVGFDEMQSGFARTGKWFGFQHYDIQPDFITIGKALGGGLPISAVVGTKELLKQSSDLWSTHSGNPICCATALAVLKTIEKKKLVKRSAERNSWFRDLLEKSFPGKKIYGRGMIWAISTGNPVITQKVIKKCAEKGLLLVSTHGSTIKIGPPLTIPDHALIEGIKIIRESFKDL